MILHWLVTISYLQAILLSLGVLLLLGAFITLLGRVDGKNQVPAWGIFCGVLAGCCWFITAWLIGKSPWHHDAFIFQDAAGPLSMFFAVAWTRRTKPKAALPQSEAATPADNVWPPPPTSQGGN